MTLALPAEDNRQLLPLADATKAVMLGSTTAFYVWCRKNKVSHFRQGQYRRQDLIDGLKYEEEARAKAKRRGKKK